MRLHRVAVGGGGLRRLLQLVVLGGALLADRAAGGGRGEPGEDLAETLRGELVEGGEGGGGLLSVTIELVRELGELEGTLGDVVGRKETDRQPLGGPSDCRNLTPMSR